MKMEAVEIIEDLREQRFTLKTDGEYLDLAPAEKVTNELIQRLRKYKPAIIAELKREERRQKVLLMLADNPETQRAFITDLNSDLDNVILTMAIRDVATFEMLIPKDKYDAFLILELLNHEMVH